MARRRDPSRHPESYRRDEDVERSRAGLLTSVLRWLDLILSKDKACGKQLRILESLSLGSRKQILLVYCAGERFLVGTGAEGVRAMVRLGGPSAAVDTEERAR